MDFTNVEGDRKPNEVPRLANRYFLSGGRCHGSISFYTRLSISSHPYRSEAIG